MSRIFHSKTEAERPLRIQNQSGLHSKPSTDRTRMWSCFNRKVKICFQRELTVHSLVTGQVWGTIVSQKETPHPTIYRPFSSVFTNFWHNIHNLGNMDSIACICMHKLPPTSTFMCLYHVWTQFSPTSTWKVTLPARPSCLLCHVLSYLPIQKIITKP